MRNSLLFIYRALVAPTAVLLALTLGALFIPKVRTGLRLRQRRQEWPKFVTKPIWIHASSGEFEYAKPFIRELKRREPNQPIVVTYFSPTYASAIEKFPGVDFSLPLPLDLPGPTRQFLARLQPKAGFLARTDLWPELLHQANQLHVPMILFSCTKTNLPNWLSRAFHRWLYSYLKAIFCVSEADCAIIKKITPQIPCVAIGDTRFDQVMERLRIPRTLRDHLKPDRARTVVAGSTWSEDERVLLDALAEPLRTGKMFLIIAPHEPTATHIESLISDLQTLRIPVSLYSNATQFSEGVLLVDEVGILAELYQWGALAFVGGSFKGSVHSVMEPLASGAITIVGPHHKNNREALDFQSLKSEDIAFVQVAVKPAELREIVVGNLQSTNETIARPFEKQFLSRSGASRRLADFVDQKQRPVEPLAEI